MEPAQAFGSAAFTVSKTASSSVAAPDQVVTYTIKVSNTGGGSGSTTFTDDFDDRLSPSTPADCTREASGNKKLTCTTGSIAAGGSRTFSYTAAMPKAFTTGAGTQGCQSGQFPVNNTATLANGLYSSAKVCVAAAAHFMVTKTAKPAVPNPGDEVTWKITITNDGSASGSIEFYDDFDDRLSPSLPEASPAGGSCAREAQTDPPSDKRFLCVSGNIAAGESQTWSYSAKVPTRFEGEPGDCGCGDGTDGRPEQYPILNRVALANGDQEILVICVNAEAKFTVVKTATPGTTTPGGKVTYSILITNEGARPASTAFTDDYDDRLTPTTPAPADVDGNPTAGTCAPATVDGNKLFSCTSATLEPGESQLWTYTAYMPTSFSGSPGPGCDQPNQYPVRNVVILASEISDDAVVCVGTTPKLGVVKAASTTTANPGQTITYTITVTNSGSGPGSIGFRDDYDDRITPTTPVPDASIPGNPTGGTCVKGTTNGNKIINCTSAVLDPGQSQVWVYTAKMPSTFTGSPGGNGCPPGPTPPGQFPVRNVVVPTSGASSEVVVCVNAAPLFTVTKTASPGTAAPGQTVTYTITIHNGGSLAGSTTFIDDYPGAIDPTTPAPAPIAGNPTGGSCEKTTIDGDKVISCTSDTIDPGKNQVWTYTAAMPLTFTGSPGGSGCPPNLFRIHNVVTLANGTKDDANVCINATPNLTVVKTATPENAVPGQEVTYRITITNSGSASGSTGFTDDYDDRIIPTTPVPDASVPGNPTGGTCAKGTTNGNKIISCTSDTLDPGESQVWRYTAKMPAKFSGQPGGSGCTSTPGNQKYPVRNVVVLVNGNSDDSVVCVATTPNLTVTKSAVTSMDDWSRTVVTYTIRVTSTGNGRVTTADVKDKVPTGAMFDGCNLGCVVTDGEARWTLTNLDPGEKVDLTLTVVVTSTADCELTNVAKVTSPDVNGGAVISSNTLVTPVTPAPDPDNAHSSGYAFGAKVTTGGLLNLTTSTLSDAQSTQSGVGGPSTDSETLLSASIPNLLSATALRTTSSSQVTTKPMLASDTSTSEVLGLCLVKVLLVCTVEASTVRSVAHAQASGSNASFSAAGSTIEKLKIAGVATPVDLTQTTKIPLAAAVFGAGSYVAINERTGGTSLSGGSYRADLEVNLIRVHITGLLAIQKVDITVAHAEAHADFPQQKVCGPQTARAVSGHAFIASAAVLPPLVLATQGFVGIPASGGSESQDLAGVNAINGQLLVAGVAATSSIGSTGPPASATSRATAADVCLLRFPSDQTKCVVMATAVKSVAISTANGSASSTDRLSELDKTELVNLKIRSTPGGPLIAVPVDVPPNFTLTLPGIGFLILNEQVCDGGSLASTGQPRCTGTTHSGLTVRAVHLVLLQTFGQFSPGVEVVVAEAHADASSS